jgi:YidC/Oxa1 family membrane protein insertase
MDRRTQLAFLLIAVILGFNLIFADRFAPQKPRSAARSDTLIAEVPSPAVPAPPAQDPTQDPTAEIPASTSQVFERAQGTEPEIEVRTPLYRLRLSPDGGVVVGLELEQFALASGERVNLIPSVPLRAGSSALGLRLQTLDSTLDLRHARFDVVSGVPASGVLEIGAGEEPKRLTMRATAKEGGALLKHFIFDPETYSILVELELDAGPGLPRVDRFSLEWTEGLESTETNQKDDHASFKLTSLVNDELQRQGAAGGFLGGKGPKDTALSGAIRWLSIKSKYFAVALIPETQESGTARMMSDPANHWMGLEIAHPLPWRGREREVYRIYAGPVDYDVLVQEDVGLEAIVELGWSWIRPISKVVVALMNFLYGFIPNYGVVILIVSVLSKLLFWPLSEKSFRAMREMQNLQPVMAELKKRYSDDPQEMNRQLMQLYKQRGVNPLGGCMPLVVQMPIFFALYSALRASIDLRNAPFMLWIDNLAAPDLLFSLPGGFPFRLLPLLMGAAMIWQSKMGSGMAATGPAAQQQAIMKWAMPVVFIFIFYGMPSGLVLYWLVNTVLSVWQQLMINRKYATPSAAGAAAAAEEHGSQGSDSDAAPDRDNGRKRGRGARKGARRAGSKPR